MSSGSRWNRVGIFCMDNDTPRCAYVCTTGGGVSVVFYAVREGGFEPHSTDGLTCPYGL